ncbi:hypothetical protein HPP92_007966 [Vanilla planifolia]|uniref:Leucine-rich repeat-containing N-terminal plant-type domain-containing protein n=1 Tax=Vanilla planifolia TaxID=51239 RepID=A0A835RRY1_VANPL|nr:hypothetical protein HPP92_007966 [Vanilla planifolia]
MLRLVVLLVFLVRSSVSLSRDGLYLLQVKRGLSDVNLALSDWDPHDLTPCNWTGITCLSDGSGSVTAIDLSGLNLSGPFPYSICRLSSSIASLAVNSLNGSIPSSLLPARTFPTSTSRRICSSAHYPPAFLFQLPTSTSQATISRVLFPFLPSAAPGLRVLSSSTTFSPAFSLTPWLLPTSS